MSTSSFEKKLAKIENDLKNLKMSLKLPAKNKKIDDCTTKQELEKFKVKELVAWLKKNRVDTKKVTKKVKATWVKLVLENLDSSDSSDSDSDSDSSDTDSDSDSSDSDSDSD